MATPWAGRYQQQDETTQVPEQSSGGGDQIAEWLSTERIVGGRAVPHWVLLLLCMCVFGAGPQSLGYLILAAAVYKLYELHAAGHTPATLWRELQASSSADCDSLSLSLSHSHSSFSVCSD